MLPLVLAAALLVAFSSCGHQTVSSDELYGTDELNLFFEETALKAEYEYEAANKGETVRKWTVPIVYCLCGGVRKTDAELISSFFDATKERIPDFPGAVQTEDRNEASLLISFLPSSDFNRKISEYLSGESAYGFTLCELVPDTNEITGAVIDFNSGMPLEQRQNVISEELYHSLGLVNDTALREDSVTYMNGPAENTLSDMDWCLLKLLYLPEMKCGMNFEDCTEIIAGHYEEVMNLCRKPQK